ncbi:MAG: hypothetical protein AAGB31_11730 [Bdellovibrio sp.]
MLSVLILSLSGLLWAQEIPWQDTEFACLDRATAQKYVRDFNISTKSFGGLELCNSEVDTKKLFNDLQIIEKGTFDAAKGDNKVFIRGLVPADKYYSWMKSQTRGVYRGHDMPTATAYNSGGYFTMQDGWALTSTLGRVGTIIHEARHTEGYRHIACAVGPYQDISSPGCDRNYEYGGSHAVEMEYYARVSVQGQNFHPVYQRMARLMGIARSNFVFNQAVIQRKEALLALSADRSEADLYLENSVYPREAPAAEGVLKRTSYGGSVFDGEHAFAIELYGSDKLNVPVTDTYSYFKILLDDPKKIFDFEEFDVGTKRYVLRMQTPRSFEFFNFAEGGWGRAANVNIAVARTTSATEDGRTGYFLIDTDNNIYPLNAQSKTLEAALPNKWNSEVVQVAAVNTHVYVLKTDGRIYERSRDGQYHLFSEDLYKGVSSTPVYDGFEVAP